MAKVFSGVCVSRVDKTGNLIPNFDCPVIISVEYDPQGLSIKLKKGKCLIIISAGISVLYFLR